MSDIPLWLRFVVGALATWRLTHLLAAEDGPFDLVARFRARLGSGFPGRLLDCFACLSLWVAVPPAFFVGGAPLDLVITWLALSGAACLLERPRQEPVILHGDLDHGMLRSEASGGDAHATAGATGVRHAHHDERLPAGPGGR